MKYLVLGATGAIGYAFVKELISKNLSVEILVRNKEKAIKLFGENQLLIITEGDVMNLKKLKSVSREKDIIFHGINTPYNNWEKTSIPILKNVIEASKINNATILFPGNIYSYGKITIPITETTIQKPTTKKGKIRKQMISLLKQEADLGNCNVIVLRLPNFYGPNVTNGLIKPLFGNAALGKKMTYLINADTPQQFVYNKDAARLFLKLSLENNLDNYFVLNYGGLTVQSVRTWAKQIGEIANRSGKISVVPKFIVNLMGIFIPLVKELRENYYMFETPITLDDNKLKKLYPDFKSTKMEVAIQETIKWFKNNP